MKHRKTKTRFLAQAGLIAAIYAVTTYLCALWGIAYGQVQFRFSEALTILPLFTPAAIPGLTVGGPGSTYPGVDAAVLSEIDKMSAEMF